MAMSTERGTLVRQHSFLTQRVYYERARKSTANRFAPWLAGRTADEGAPHTNNVNSSCASKILPIVAMG